ncbi:hypothetical protein GCM10027431_00900 [Lysobacter rhizosphaerae]
MCSSSAKAGIHFDFDVAVASRSQATVHAVTLVARASYKSNSKWIPAFAGMTSKGTGGARLATTGAHPDGDGIEPDEDDRLPDLKFPIPAFARHPGESRDPF